MLVSEYYQTIPNRDWLIGMKVKSISNDKELFITSVDGGIWCSKTKDSDFGSFYSMDDLEKLDSNN